MHLRALAPPALAAATLALLAPPAGAAAVRYVYEGTLDGTVALNVSEASNGGLQTVRLDVGVQLHATLPQLEFVGGRFVSQGKGRATVTPSGVDLHYLYVNRDVDPVDVVDCRSSTVTVSGPPLANPLASFLRTVPPATIDLLPATMLDFGRIGCSKGFVTIGFGAQMDYFEPVLQSHLHARVEVPRDDVGDSSLTLPFTRSSSALEKCPWVQSRPSLVSCTTLWRGVLRLVRTYPTFTEEDDIPLAPLMPPRRARLDRRASRATVAARCPRGCRLDIGIFVSPRRGRGPRIERRSLGRAAASQQVARKTVTLPAGRAERTVTVAIPARHRAALRAAGRARFDLTATPPQGRAVHRVVMVNVGR